MVNTIHLDVDSESIHRERAGVIDFMSINVVLAPKIFGYTKMDSFTEFDPLIEKYTSFYDGFDCEFYGKIAINRVGISEKIGDEYHSVYNETVDLSNTSIKSIEQKAFGFFDFAVTLTFSKNVSYYSIAGKKLGELINNGDKIFGTATDDTLRMTNKSEIVDGGSGNDTVAGRGGDDILKGNTGDDALVGGSGRDTLEGGLENDLLQGDAGNDTIVGGRGVDQLYGGVGADRFVFTSYKDSTTTVRDIIYDFSRSQGDRIDLSGIDARSTTSTNDAFTFIGEKSFTKKAGELAYVNKNDNTYLYGDVNGDGRADFSLRLDMTIDLVKGDFIL